MKETTYVVVVVLLIGAGAFFILKDTDTTSNKKTSITQTENINGATTETLPVINSTTTKPMTTETTKLIIEDQVVGTGAEAKSGDSVTVHYVGTLLNGTVFDASRNHGDQGFTFLLGAGQVIKGWDQGVAGMKVGGKRKLTIPADLAYGNQAVGGVIPANATLIFEVELLKVGN